MPEAFRYCCAGRLLIHWVMSSHNLFVMKKANHAHYPRFVKVSCHHKEEDNKTGARLSDVILGGQDGLVNTLGVILGLAAASSDFRIIVAGGLAGAIAEAVSMGAVGYTSKVAERDYYQSELNREKYEIAHMPEAEEQEIREIYEKKGFSGKLLEEAVKVVISNEKVWLDTMMQEELNLAPMDGKRPLRSALLIGFTSFLGAIIPLIPFAFFYFFGIKYAGDVTTAIFIALGLAALALFAAGAVKSKLTVGSWYRSGFQMLVIGIISALSGYLIGALFTL